MAKEKKQKKQEQVQKKTPPADCLARARERNKGVDMFSPASGLTLHLPTSSTRAFLAKAEVFEVPSRLGEGPCQVEIKFMMPNGDIALPGDTFDPVIERMSPGKYGSLKSRKFFSLRDKKYEPKYK